MSQVPTPTPLTADEIRLKNGFRVLVAAFVALLLSFLALLLCYGFVNNSVVKPDSTKPAISATELVAILGVVTAIIGTLVGAYFGVSAANGARDAASTQANSTNELAQRMLGQLPPDAAKKVTG
jgi:hypothetical protein